jgi:hypothetical protein
MFEQSNMSETEVLDMSHITNNFFDWSKNKMKVNLSLE